MLIKKADVKNHLAAKLRKHCIFQDLAGGQIPTERSSVADDGITVTAKSHEQVRLLYMNAAALGFGGLWAATSFSPMAKRSRLSERFSKEIDES